MLCEYPVELKAVKAGTDPPVKKKTDNEHYKWRLQMKTTNEDYKWRLQSVLSGRLRQEYLKVLSRLCQDLFL